MQSLVLIPRGASLALATLWGNPGPRRVGVGPRSREREHCPSGRMDGWAWAKRRSASLTASAGAVPGPSAGSEEAEKILVLGGSGFVGSKVCEILTEKGYQVVSISRSRPRVSAEWIKGDLVSDPGLSGQVLKAGGFSGLVHAVGMLLPNDWNALASGSGSKPSPGSTYDQVTRSTAVEAARALAESDTKRKCPPFVFVSAAEAGWDPGAPLVPPFLQEYLAAKRAVEEELLERQGAEGQLRPVILRPSLIWTPDRPLALPAVTAFAIGSAVGVPGVERPVRLETLAAAAVAAIADDSVQGVLKWQAMEALAAGQPDTPAVQQ